MKKTLELLREPDPSGKYRREDYLFKYHPEVHKSIIQYCIDNEIDGNIEFREKCYLALNEMLFIPKCLNDNCNNRVKFKNSTLGYLEYCSNKCIACEKTTEKKRKNSLAKYGTTSPQQLYEVKKKTEQTNLERYGTKSPLQNKDIKEKSIKTLIENHGVDNPGKSKEIIEKRVISFKENVNQYKESYRKTSLLKYGKEHPWMVEEIHRKTVESSIKTKNEKYINRISEDNNVIDIDFINNVNKIKCDICNSIYDISFDLLYHRKTSKTVKCTICNPINVGVSGIELDLYNYISSIYYGEIIRNNRNIISKEIDIYLPEIKIAIEFNGLWWHSEENKPINYHKDKWLECKEKNIELLSIWDFEWINDRDKIEIIILNKINKDKIYEFDTYKKDNKIYATFKGKTLASVDVSIINDMTEYSNIELFSNIDITTFIDKICSSNYYILSNNDRNLYPKNHKILEIYGPTKIEYDGLVAYNSGYSKYVK